MPIDFRYDQQLGILFTTAAGLISLADILDHLNREADAGGLACKELFDASAATTNLSSSDVQTIADVVRQRLTGEAFGPTAIVTMNDVFFGMSRMLEILSDLNRGPRFGVFRNRDDALQWLEGISVDLARCAVE